MAREATTEEVRFTPIQQKMLAILSDGQPHTKEELHSVCHPESRVSLVRQHVAMIRKKLTQKGETILCEYSNKGYFYRHVRLLRH